MLTVRTLEEVPEGATHWPKRELTPAARSRPQSLSRVKAAQA
jgi:hypothetical protein